MERAGPLGRIQRRILPRRARGASMALFALLLPALLGMGALAVDVGYVYMAQSALQNAADAGAMAGAGVLAQGDSQADAQAAAASFANRNTAGVGFLSGAAPAVNFPTADSVRVSYNFSVPLFFAPVIGIGTAAVPATATAALVPVSQVPGNGAVPLAIFCNNPGGCTGQLAVNQAFTNLFRHCGNFFGTSGEACNFNPSAPAAGETFVTGITFDGNNSANQFSDGVYGGLAGDVDVGDIATALPGRRQGWESGMINRLAEGRREMTFMVIRPVGGNPSQNNVEVVDFVRVRVDAFSAADQPPGSAPDRFNLTVINQQVSSTRFGQPGQGVGANSVMAVRLTN